MADDITRPARSYSTHHRNGGHDFDEDPLVELARIVSDDGSFFQSRPAKPADSAEPDTIVDPFSADLEAELMEQFESAFTNEAVGADNVAYAAEPEPAPSVAPEREGGEYSASDSQALGEMAIEADVRSREDISADAADGQIAPFAPGDQFDDDLPTDPSPDYLADPAIEPAVEPIADPYRAAPDVTKASSTADVLQSKSFEMEFADALADTASPPIAEDFTPEFGIEAYGRDPEFQVGQADDDYPDSHYAGLAADGGGNVDDDYDGDYEQAMAMPPLARSGGRKGLIAVVGVLAVVVLGGGVAAYIGKVTPNDSATPAPIIKAESSDVKIMADATDMAATAPSVLDPLAGQQVKSEEKLIDRIEEPQQIARVVLPGPVSEDTTQLKKPVGEQTEKPSGSVSDAIGKTIDRVMQETGQPAAAPKFDPIGPRKVRTVVIKPDGSVVSNDDAEALTRPALPAPPATETMEVASVNSTQSPKPTPVKTVEITSAPATGETIAGLGNTAIGADTAAPPAQVANTEPMAPVMETGETGNAMQAMAVPTGAIPRAKPAKVPDTIVAAAPPGRSTSEPVNLLAAPAETDQPRVTASTPLTATEPAATGQSGYVVQVSSQRNADQAQAAFADMQRRYRSILGGFKANIQRADLGARGTYYRVRVGPMASRNAALQICEQLKSAGGSCFVTR
ncbi:MAG: SPOR domain-containing protein [Hyphomicrobiales bacterium]|nr:SPOR domain-containing protein [Hyphomicrobiales bacterium]